MMDDARSYNLGQEAHWGVQEEGICILVRNKSQHERGRKEVRSMRKDGSPPTVDLKLIEGKVDDILKKQNI